MAGDLPDSASKPILAEHTLQRLSLRVRGQMPIPLLLLFGLMPYELVDDPLIDALHGEVRAKAVAEDMTAPHHLPLSSCQYALEMIVVLVTGKRLA
jgi:hypothetical protein